MPLFEISKRKNMFEDGKKMMSTVFENVAFKRQV
jgi:hypothetical protein